MPVTATIAARVTTVFHASGCDFSPSILVARDSLGAADGSLIAATEMPPGAGRIHPFRVTRRPERPVKSDQALDAGDADDDGQLGLAVSRSWRAAVPTPARAVTVPDTLLALRCVARVPTADWSWVRADVRLLICPLQWSPAALAALARLDSFA